MHCVEQIFEHPFYGRESSCCYLHWCCQYLGWKCDACWRCCACGCCVVATTCRGYPLARHSQSIQAKGERLFVTPRSYVYMCIYIFISTLIHMCMSIITGIPTFPGFHMAACSVLYASSSQCRMQRESRRNRLRRLHDHEHLVARHCPQQELALPQS